MTEPLSPADVLVSFEDGMVVAFVPSRRVYGYGTTYEKAKADLRDSWAGFGFYLAELDAAMHPSDEWIEGEALMAKRAETQRKLTELQGDDPVTEEEMLGELRKNRQSDSD